METIIGRMAARLTGDSSDFSRATDQATAKVQNFDAKIAQSGESLKKHASLVDNAEKAFGRLAVTVGKIALTALIADAAVAAGAIGLATAEAIKFESSFAGVRKTVDASPSEFDALSQSIRQMAKELPVNVNELNKIGEAAGQLGVHKENITEFIKTIAQIAATTNLTADQAADGFARFSNIMQTPQDRISNLGSAVVDLGNKFAGTESEILAMALRLAGAGHTVGMTEGQVLGLATALSSVGIEAEAGGSAFSKVFIDMADAAAGNSKKARQMLQDMATVMGTSATELGKRIKEDAAGSVVDLVTALGKLQKQGADVFGILESLGIEDIRMRDAILRAAGASDIFTDALKTGTTALEENTALGAEAAKRFETTESKITMAKNAMVDMGITIGGPFKDALGELLSGFAETIKGGEDLTRVVEEFTPTIKGAADELKPLIKGFAQDAPAAIETFGAAILTLKGYLDVLGRVLDTVGGKLGMMAAPAAGLKDAIGEALFGDFARDVERKKAELRGEAAPETTHQTADRRERLLKTTGMSEHQIRDLAAQGLGPGLPDSGRPDSSDYIMSGGVPVLKSQAEQRLKDAEEAQRIWSEAEKIENQVSGEMAQPPGQADNFKGRAPESKEDRVNRERAEKAAADKARREAEAAMAKAQREAEAAAQRHADMVASFNRTIEEGAYAVEENLGKFAQRANAALGDIFDAKSGGSEGGALAKAIGDLIKQAKDAGVPQAEEMGAALVAAASNAIITKSPEAKAAAQAIIDQMNAGILEASKLTADTFSKAWDREALSFQLGKTGADIMESLDKAINAGGVKNIDSLAKAVAGMRRVLVEDLNPEMAAELGGQMMELLAQAIDEKSPEAIQALEDFLRKMNTLLPLEKAGEAMAERINKAIDAAAKRIHEIQDAAAKRIEEAQNSLIDSRELRAARENVSVQQAAALKEATEAIDKERQAYKDMRDEQHVLDARKLEDSETAHKRQMEDTKALKDFNDSMKENNLHRTTGMSSSAAAALAERGRAGGFDVGPRADPALDARKAFEKKKKETEDARVIEDAETLRRRGIEDEQRKTRNAERDEDALIEARRQANLDQFKKDQSKDVQRFEDLQADAALERENARTIAASELEISKANEALATLEADENEKFANLQAKIEALAAVSIATVATAGDSALDGMVDDSETVRDNMLEAEAAQNRMNGGTGGPVAAGGTSRKPAVPTGGIDGPGGMPAKEPLPPVDPGNDPGGDPGSDPGSEPPAFGNGAVVSAPTLAYIADKHAPEIVAPLDSMQAMVNSAAYAGVAQYEMGAGASNAASGPKIEMYNPQFYGTGGPKAFTRQVNRDLSNDARDKQAVQGD